MSQQPTNPQPSDQAIIRVQGQEMNRLNDNRIYLLALIEEIQAEAMQEIGRLQGQLASVTSMVKDDKNRDEISAFLNPANPAGPDA